MTGRADDHKKTEIMDFLNDRVFNPILGSERASKRLKTGVRYTIMRLNERDHEGIRNYYWSAIIGTEKSIPFAEDMRREGFTRFEEPEVLEEFRLRFNDEWLRSET